MNNYYDLLQQIHEKPGLYIGSPSISSLYMFLAGYQFAQRQSHIALSGQEEEFREFQPWLQKKFGVQSSHSWSHLILFQSVDERDAFKRFFQLFAEFLQCRQADKQSRQVEKVRELA